ncbi:MAG TPA: DUF885 domain-containing protein [Candidatus Cybelea sp.]|jgi:uncharacterized protein (DUF885 family)|nr:DUF885 domain-containing protein [Candidatus Cybelea sp.]
MNTRLLLVLAMLLTASTPVAAPAQAASSNYQAKLEDLGRRYTMWSYEENPSSATDAGIHTYDARLADYSPQVLAAQMVTLRGFRNELAALQPTPGTSPHDRVDYLLLRSNIESDWWGRTVLRSVQRNPSVYEGECSNGIFSIIKRRYASDEVRIQSAIARLRACPRVLAQGKAALTQPVREFAQIASEDIRDGDALYTTSLNEVASDAPAQMRQQLAEAQKIALDGLHGYRAWLDSRMSTFPAGGFAVGRKQYDWFLRRVLMLPFDSSEVARIGRLELARDRALEVWEKNRDAHEPAATPAPTFATKEEFLAYYERSLQKLISFINSRQIVTIPSYIGPFHIVEVPKALAATYPGGFMNPPQMFSDDRQGFYFVPDFSSSNQSFFVQQARQSVLPLLGHEGIPGHFLQFTYAYHNPDFIRHVQQDGVFAEGWAFYGEEMLMREGLYGDDPGARQQVIHLMRHRATRIGVDVGLATGAMTLPQAIAYFEKNAGIDEVTARGEATRFAMDPGQAIDYLTGKTQIEMLIGMVHDREGANFTLQAFHDRLLSYGTVPYSTIRYEWLGDDAWLRPALAPLGPQRF